MWIYFRVLRVNCKFLSFLSVYYWKLTYEYACNLKIYFSRVLFGILSYCSVNVILIHKLNSFTGVLTLELCYITSLICNNTVTTQISDFFQENLLKVLKYYNFLWVQRRHNCSPAASFTNCVMTLYLLKVHLQTLLSIPITKKCHILSSDTLVENERYVDILPFKLEES